MLDWIGSRVYLFKPRARNGFRKTRFHLFIRSLSSLKIYLCRMLLVVYNCVLFGRTVTRFMVHEFLQVQTRRNFTASTTPDEPQVREQHTELGGST
jgi:hypothetical protein